MELLKTIFLNRLQRRKKNKIRDCSDRILPLNLVPKRWETLPDFHWLLIHPCPSNGLEVMEICALTKLLKSVWDRTTTESMLNSED
jgi:hypothetical protein